MGPGSALPLSKEYRRYSYCDMKLATNLHLVPRLTMGGAVTPSSLGLYDAVAN
jgi:hypothetical protein